MKLVLALFTVIALLPTSTIGADDREQAITITVPAGAAVNVVRGTNTPPAPPMPRVTSLSHEMRMAAQLAAGQAAPWTQRFIVTRVEEDARTRNDGVSNLFSTNYVVTVAPVTGETNDPTVWGAVKARTIRFVTTRPTKKGDEFELFPVTDR